MLHHALFVFQSMVLMFQAALPPDIWATLVPIIIGAATPFIVQGVTWVVVKYMPQITGWGVVGILVPIVAGAVTLVTNWITTTGPLWYAQLGLGLVAVFVNELYKQIKSGSNGPVSANIARGVKMIAVVLLIPVVMSLSACSTAIPIGATACSIGDQVCYWQGQLCQLMPHTQFKSSQDSAAFVAKQKYITDTLYVLAGQLRAVTK